MSMDTTIWAVQRRRITPLSGWRFIHLTTSRRDAVSEKVECRRYHHSNVGYEYRVRKFIEAPEAEQP
jgi:hypothetical protein